MTGLFIAVAVLISGPLPAQEDFFLEGNRQYQEGDYRGALESYLRIEDAGFESGRLYYNIGNTYFKLAELGPAILYFERARRLMAGDDDLEANLRLARSLTVDEVTPLPGFLPIRAIRWWVHLLPVGILAWIVGTAYVVCMAAVTLVLLRPRTAVAVWGGRIAVVAASVVIVLGTNLVALELKIGEPRRAVVMAEAVDVHSAPSDDPSLQVFTVHEGTTVQIDRQSDGWVEVVLLDGQVGWLPSSVLEQI